MGQAEEERHFGMATARTTPQRYDKVFRERSIKRIYCAMLHTHTYTRRHTHTHTHTHTPIYLVQVCTNSNISLFPTVKVKLINDLNLDKT